MKTDESSKDIERQSYFSTATKLVYKTTTVNIQCHLI